MRRLNPNRSSDGNLLDVVDVDRKRPRLPKAWAVKKTGRGILCSVELDEERRALDSTTEFRVRWAREVDMTTVAGVSAGFSRSTAIATIAVVNHAETLVADEEKQSGYFFLEAADADGRVSDPSSPRFIAGAGLLGGVPGVVQRWRGTESGVMRDNTAFSLVKYACEAPEPLGAFWGVQPVLLNYPTLGEISLGEAKQFVGVAGGSLQGEIVLPPGRRSGQGTVTTTAASAIVTFGGAENCLARVQPGDYLEILGVQAQIKSVDGALQVTLGDPGGAAVNWPGKIVTAITSYDFISNVRIYARSLSQEQTGEIDLASMPYFEVVLDGLGSPPNAPTLSAAQNSTSKISTIGNINRIYITPLIGVEIKGYVIYRAAGAAIAFTDPTMERIGWVDADHHNPTGLLPFDDSKFTITQREQNQVFSYYATMVNNRDQESAPSARVEVACRLDNGGDGNEPVGRIGMTNLLYNGALGGTHGNQVLANDLSQDHWFDVVAGVDEPGRPYNSVTGQVYGLGRFRGYTRWCSGDGGTGAAGRLEFTNQSEVWSTAAPGLGKGHFLFQEIEAWDTNAAAVPAVHRFRKIKRAGIYTLSCAIKSQGGTPPNGKLLFFIEQHNNGPKLGNAKRRYRDSASDELMWTTADYEISASVLLTSWQRFYATFLMWSDLSPTRQIHVNLAWLDGTEGGVAWCEVMLVPGEEFGVFTNNMGDPTVSVPANPADPPSGIGDGTGGRTGRYLEP